MIKLLSLFSGIGAFEKALDNIGVDYELVNYCEIDKYASKSYSLIHNVDESKNLKDVTKVDTSKIPNDIDLVTYGFPCQDISIAGKQKGFKDEEGNTTRSGLFFEALRIIEDTKPKIAIAENVKALTSKRFTFVYTITTKQVRCPNAGVIEIDKNFGNYRYLTEVECFRLMGFDNEDYDVLKQNGISSTEIYKQAGNSIVVDVLEVLFKELFKAIAI